MGYKKTGSNILEPVFLCFELRYFFAVAFLSLYSLFKASRT